MQAYMIEVRATYHVRGERIAQPYAFGLWWGPFNIGYRVNNSARLFNGPVDGPVEVTP